MTRQQAQTLLEDTRLKVTTVAAILVLLIANGGGVSWLIWKTDARLTALEKETIRLEDKKRDKGVNSWTRETQVKWSHDLADRNPGLNVPDANSLIYRSED